MAVKQNGVLATFVPGVTPYSNLRLSSVVTPTAFNFYTTPSATMTSARLFIANDTGSAASVDVAIVEQTDVLQLDAPANQPGAPSDFGAFTFAENTYTSSIYIEGGGVTGTFQAGEQVTWTNSGLPAAYQSVSATVLSWDAANSKLWLRNMSHPLAMEVSGDTTVTGTTSGATISAGPSYAGSGGTDGHSGIVKYYDSNLGRVYFLNYEHKNNVDYKVYGETTEVFNQTNNVLARSQSHNSAPVATTMTRYAAAGNTTPTTEFLDTAGTELLISGVSQVQAQQYLVKSKSIADNEHLELNGLVLGPGQSLFVSSAAAVSCTLMGYEEVAEIPS